MAHSLQLVCSHTVVSRPACLPCGFEVVADQSESFCEDILGYHVLDLSLGWVVVVSYSTNRGFMILVSERCIQICNLASFKEPRW